MNHIQKFHEALSTRRILSRARSQCYLMGLGVPDPRGFLEQRLGCSKNTVPKRVRRHAGFRKTDDWCGAWVRAGGHATDSDHQRLDFALLAMEQMVNQRSNWHYTFGGS